MAAVDDAAAQPTAAHDERLARLEEKLDLLLGERAGPKRAAVRVAELHADYRKARAHEHSWRTIQDKLAPLVRLAGTEAASDLTPVRWEKHRQQRRTEVMDYGRSKGKPPAESTLNIELACAKVMLEWAVEHSYLEHNPLRKTRRSKQKGKRKTWLREPDLQRLLMSPVPIGREQRLAFTAFVLGLFDCGLRFNEVRRLRRDRVRAREEFDELTGDADAGWMIDIDETKNSRAHTVGLTARFKAALDAIPEVDGSPFYFCRRETKQLWGERTIRWWFRRACEESKVDALVADGEVRVRPHDGRRSAATNAHNRGGTLLEIQHMLNHSSPAITADYVQQNESNALRMARIIEEGAARERRRKPAQRVGVTTTATAKSERGGNA